MALLKCARLDRVEQRAGAAGPAVIGRNPQPFDMWIGGDVAPVEHVTQAHLGHADRPLVRVKQDEIPQRPVFQHGGELVGHLDRIGIGPQPRPHRRPCGHVAYPRGADLHGIQTVKLSPQPHAPLAFGFSNTKPAAKSSSTQSMTLPIR